MFTSLGLFQNISCPDKDTCKRSKCLFSHRSDIPTPSLQIPVDEPTTTTTTSPPPPLPQQQQQQQQSIPQKNRTTIPAKRPVTSPLPAGTSKGSAIGEPPRKLQKLGVSRPVAIPTTSHTSTGVPILRVNAAQSQVAVPVRQAMLKSLYDHFVVLYNAISPANPTLASEHSLRQEEEVYNKSNKITYRNAVITSIAALKRRSVPDSLSHASVGTEGDLLTRAESRKSLDSLRLTRDHLEDLILSMADLRKWGYIVDIPDGPGGDRPSEEGKITKCERCAQPFMVKRMEMADECLYHWGKPYARSMNGEKSRVYSCCSRPTTQEAGCARGPHVFYESKPEDLHARHPFSHSRPSSSAGESSADTALDVVCLDCEMIYTTGGMRVARVSVVDGSGSEIFDEFVRMDDGVEVIDYNTRFSGITQEHQSKALLPLASIRRSLDAFINSDTVMIGHALENDLKTLRIIHHQCVDTAILFPHRAGAPYRRALRDLVRENLKTLIQTGGGTSGHSSVEDSIATLDLVRWYVLNTPKSKAAKIPPEPSASRLGVQS